MPLGFSLFDRGVSFNPETDIPDLTGKVILITGGNTGLGKQTALQLSQHTPKHIYLSARSPAKAHAAIQAIQESLPGAPPPPPITFLPCDLSSLASVQAAARTFTQQESRLDMLILNAGVMASAANRTADGYEEQFGTNHVGHALLTKLLLPTLLRTAAADPGADVRVVSVSSIGHLFAPAGGIVFGDLKTDMRGSFTLTRYAQSKLANVLFVKELAGRYPAITAVAVHPGVVSTELYRTAAEWFVIGRMVRAAKAVVYTSVEDGVKCQIWAATARLKKAAGEGGRGVESGEFYTPVGVGGQGSTLSNDAGLAKRLWEWTEKELEGYTL